MMTFADKIHSQYTLNIAKYPTTSSLATAIFRAHYLLASPVSFRVLASQEGGNAYPSFATVASQEAGGSWVGSNKIATISGDMAIDIRKA